jgi:hypothetical protein
MKKFSLPSGASEVVAASIAVEKLRRAKSRAGAFFIFGLRMKLTGNCEWWEIVMNNARHVARWKKQTT